MLTLALLTLGVNAASAGQVQRLPRQTFSDVAAIAGIVTTQDGLGLGGVAVVLQNVDTGRSLTATSNGDGSFRFVNLMPGRYQVNATRDGFVPFAQRDVNVRAGDLLPLLFTMPAVPSGADALRELPRLPALGPKPPPLPPQPATSSTYRNLPSQPPPAE